MYSDVTFFVLLFGIDYVKNQKYPVLALKKEIV